MDRNRSGSPVSIYSASQESGATLLSAAIAWFSFELDLRYSKDHAMTVIISRRHACDQVKLVRHLRGRNLG
ncbi:hypothetical protein [Streptosporangium jomthongense]|uniref:Tn3 transposase DDE domain-containing protein n=1 Tax=Streptosporangium jomthongense TaxID=1193683 RepID=A0ABV8F5W7_9ACTN